MSTVGGEDVVIKDDETVSSGSGLKLAIFQKELATTTLPELYTAGKSPFLGTDEQTVANVSDANQKMRDSRLQMLRGICKRANAIGEAIGEQYYFQTVVDKNGLSHSGKPKVKFLASTVTENESEIVVTIIPSPL